MKLSFYFDIYPWSKPTDNFYASTMKDTKPNSAKRYRVDVEVDDPAQPDEIVNAQPIEVIE